MTPSKEELSGLVEKVDKSVLWDKWEPNSTGTLGFHGEVFPNACPVDRKQCDYCPCFMGHRVSSPAYVGQAANFCCAILLSLQSQEPTP